MNGRGVGAQVARKQGVHDCLCSEGILKWRCRAGLVAAAASMDHNQGPSQATGSPSKARPGMRKARNMLAPKRLSDALGHGLGSQESDLSDDSCTGKALAGKNKRSAAEPGSPAPPKAVKRLKNVRTRPGAQSAAKSGLDVRVSTCLHRVILHRTCHDYAHMLHRSSVCCYGSQS